MATIATVAPDTLITSAWGNSVASELNNQCLKKTGGNMTGHLTVDGAITANGGVVLEDAPTATWHATRKDYVDNAIATAGNAYVAVTGDTMTGNLQVGGNPYVDNTAGSHVGAEGQIATHVTAAAGAGSANPNLSLNRTGHRPVNPPSSAPPMSTSCVTASIGSIKITSAPGVAYNETSDYRLKDIVGAVGRSARCDRTRYSHAVCAGRRPGSSSTGSSPTKCRPSSPTPSRVSRTPCYQPTIRTTRVRYDPQQLDTGKLIPYLVAAVQALAARVAALEGTG